MNVLNFSRVASTQRYKEIFLIATLEKEKSGGKHAIFERWEKTQHNKKLQAWLSKSVFSRVAYN